MEQSRKKKKHTESKLTITICLPNVFFYDTDFMQGGNNMITDLQKQKAIFHHLQAFAIIVQVIVTCVPASHLPWRIRNISPR